MKLTIFFVFLLSLASVNAFAQQAPSRSIKLPPAAPMAPPQASQPNNTELTDLLRAQTTAIKSLSNKLDSLEKRIDKIERGER